MPKVSQQVVEGRRREAAGLLRAHRYLGVVDLAGRLGVSVATARRDLAALAGAEGNAVRRTFGGAVADYARRFASFDDRRPVNAAAKAAIAARAVALVADLPAGATLFLDAGTTCDAVAERLASDRAAAASDGDVAAPLDVVTHSLAVADHLADAPGVAVHVLGGRLLPRQSVLLDERTVTAAGRRRYALALLGAEGFDASGAWNSAQGVVALQRAVIGRSARCALCLDATKLGRRAPARLGPWSALGDLVTDADPAFLRRAGIDPGAGRTPRTPRASGAVGTATEASR